MTRYGLMSLLALPLMMTIACQSSSPPVDTKKHAVAAGGTPTTASPSDQHVGGPTPNLPKADQQMLDQLKRQEPQFKEHYDHHYAGSGYTYNQYRPAYQYGYELAMDQRYRTMDWVFWSCKPVRDGMRAKWACGISTRMPCGSAGNEG